MTRQATLQDFVFIYDLYMHPVVNPFLLYEKMDARSFRPIFEDLINRAVKYVYYTNAEMIGMFKLVPMTYRAGHIVYLGGLAIQPALSGKGEGLNMLNEIVALAGEKGFLRIDLSVSVENDKAIRLYEKAGFQKEGILKKYTYLKSEGRYVDEILMAFLF